MLVSRYDEHSITRGGFVGECRGSASRLSGAAVVSRAQSRTEEMRVFIIVTLVRICKKMLLRRLRNRHHGWMLELAFNRDGVKPFAHLI